MYYIYQTPNNLSVYLTRCISQTYDAIFAAPIDLQISHKSLCAPMFFISHYKHLGDNVIDFLCVINVRLKLLISLNAFFVLKGTIYLAFSPTLKNGSKNGLNLVYHC